MYPCDNRYNYTFAVYPTDTLLYVVDGKEIKGLWGEHLYKVISSKKGRPLIDEPYEGTKQPNGSYSGALGMLEKKIIDLYVKNSNPFAFFENVAITPALSSEDYSIGHIIDKETDMVENERMQLLRSIDIEFLILSILSFLTYLVIFTTLICLFFKRINFEFLFRVLTNRCSSPISKHVLIRLSVCGLIIFSFIVVQIMTNTIKTVKVVVNTENVLTNEEKLMKSPKIAVWAIGENDNLIAQNAPNNSFLERMFRLKNTNPITFAERKVGFWKFGILEKGFIFMESFKGYLGFKFVSSFLPYDFFFNEKPFYTVIGIFFRQKGKNERLLQLDRYINTLIQSGVYVCFTNTLKSMRYATSKEHSGRFYSNIKSYIEDNTSFTSIKLNYFFYVFIGLIPFQLCIFTWFLLHRVLKIVYLY